MSLLASPTSSPRFLSAGTDIGLPGLQSAFALAVLAAAARAHIPVILVLVHNLPVSFDELVQVRVLPFEWPCSDLPYRCPCATEQPANASYAPVSAIVDAWAPTMHADVVADAVFGRVNRWGKSVLTVRCCDSGR